MSLFDRIGTLVPDAWLQAERLVMGKLAAGLAGFQDALAEIVYQARMAAIPGQVDLPGVPGAGDFDSFDALPWIARDRAVVPALAETPFQLAARCRSWLDDAAAQTGPFGLLDALAEHLVPSTPVLRLVTYNGTITSWFTRNADGSRRLQRSDGQGLWWAPDGSSGTDTTVAATWDWSSQNTNPAPGDQADFSRFWIILYAPLAGIYCTAGDKTFADLGYVGDGYNDPPATVAQGSPWAGTVGTNAPVELVEELRAILRQRRAGGNPGAFFVVAFDPASFSPDGSSSAPTEGTAYPTGWWGYPSRWDSGTNRQIKTRNPTAEYWPVAPGGRAK